MDKYKLQNAYDNSVLSRDSQHDFGLVEVNPYFWESRIKTETMFGCDNIFLNKITVNHIEFGKCLIYHPQSVRRRDHLVVKTIVAGSEQYRQNQLKNHAKHENWQSYQNSEKNNKQVKKLHTPMLVFFGFMRTCQFSWFS